MIKVSDNKDYIKLENYKSFDYEIPDIFLDFIIEDTKVIVKTELKLIKKNININKDDIANELSNVALKHDIAEELERISFHIESLNKLFKFKNAHGKKMDFILQELFREVNTLSVKIEKPDLKDLALTMKLKVEELREQAQNLE